MMKKAKKPIGATMRIGPLGDHNGVSVEECAVRMAKAGADIIGMSCNNLNLIIFELSSLHCFIFGMRSDWLDPFSSVCNIQGVSFIAERLQPALLL